MLKNCEKLQKSRHRYAFEDWLFGCTCCGPCHHTHGKFQEWFWNTDHLFPIVAWLWYTITGFEKFEG